MKVRLNVPEISHMQTADGVIHTVEIDDAGRFIMIEARLARRMICTGLPSSLPLRDANAKLAEALGPLRQQRPTQRDAIAPRSREQFAVEAIRQIRRWSQ